MKYTFYFVVVALLFSTSLIGQKVLTTNSGQRILLVDDGSWRLISETETLDGEASESGPSLNSFKSPKQGKYPITPDQREMIQNLLTTLMSDEAQLIVNVEMGKRKMNQLKEEKSKSKKEKNKDNTEKLKNQIANTKKSIKSDEKFYKETSKLIELSNDLLDGKVKNKDKAFASLELKSKTFDAINSGMGGLSSGEEEEEEVNENNTIEAPQPKKYSTSFSIEESRGSKNNYDCEIVFDGFDEAIGSERREVKTQPFFSFSQEKMKPYFKTDDYLKCSASISKVDKKYYLTLNIRIRSKDASKTYGMLRAQENIKIQLIDGRSVYGTSINNDVGKIESYTGHTLYTGIFELDKGDVNELKSNYLDSIGIIWSSGYEEYEIYNVDFLTNQIECLSK